MGGSRRAPARSAAQRQPGGPPRLRRSRHPEVSAPRDGDRGAACAPGARRVPLLRGAAGRGGAGPGGERAAPFGAAGFVSAARAGAALGGCGRPGSALGWERPGAAPLRVRRKGGEGSSPARGCGAGPAHRKSRPVRRGPAGPCAAVCRRAGPGGALAAAPARNNKLVVALHRARELIHKN